MQFYDQLLQFPLFQGLSRNEMLQMAGNTKFGFMKLRADEVVVRDGDSCSQLHFLTKGQMTIIRHSDDHATAWPNRCMLPGYCNPRCSSDLRHATR